GACVPAAPCAVRRHPTLWIEGGLSYTLQARDPGVHVRFLRWLPAREVAGRPDTKLGTAEVSSSREENGLAKPIFFFRVSFFRGLAMVATPGGELAGMIEPVLGSMGYELVDIEFGGAGLL